MTDFILETLTIVLLISVLCVAWYLNKRIISLKAISQELSPLLNNLTGILTRSSSHLESLKNLSRDTKEFLAIQVPKADALKDDLIFLVDHGEKIARQLDASIDTHRQAQQSKPQHYSQPHPQVNAAPQHLQSSTFVPPMQQMQPQYAPTNVQPSQIDTYGSNGRMQATYYDNNPRDQYAHTSQTPSVPSYPVQEQIGSHTQRSVATGIKENFDPYGEYPAQPLFKPNQTLHSVNMLSNLKKIR